MKQYEVSFKTIVVEADNEEEAESLAIEEVMNGNLEVAAISEF